VALPRRAANHRAIMLALLLLLLATVVAGAASSTAAPSAPATHIVFVMADGKPEQQPRSESTASH
jgi:ABC-type glycerol-3-phosphate transport system substrate-binding protein